MFERVGQGLLRDAEEIVFGDGGKFARDNDERFLGWHRGTASYCPSGLAEALSGSKNEDVSA